MSDLIAVAYAAEETAGQVRDTLARLQRDGVIENDDALVVVRGRDGRVRVDQAIPPIVAGAVGAAGGALWGTLIGTVLLAPLLGLVLGALSGAVSGALGRRDTGGVLSDYGVEEQLVSELGAQLLAGTSALFLLVRRVQPERVLEEVQHYGGTVLRSSLGREAEERIQLALRQVGPRAGGDS